MSVGEESADRPPVARPAFARSTGSPRGAARRAELLRRVTDDLSANGLVDFSLRRAARAAGTTHKVLLYYFDNVDDLLGQAILGLREQRVITGMAAAAAEASGGTLAGRVRAIWPTLVAEGTGSNRVLDQAIGLTMYDPVRYADLGREVSRLYLPSLVSICPTEWSESRKLEVSQMILATLRGFLIEWITSGTSAGVEAGLDALARALDREESAV